MVVHETYRGKDGKWLSPAEVRIEEGESGRKAFLISDGSPVSIGGI
jgi:leucyl-tRNA synthetase